MCGERTGAVVLWQPSHHPSGCCTLVVVEERPPHMIVKRIGCTTIHKKRYINASFILPPRPGGLLSHWLLMDLALHSLPRFHLRSTALLDCAVCVKRLEAALWGGGALSRIWLPLTTLQLHITHGLQLPLFTVLRHTHSCHESGCLSPHYSCTSPMDYNSHYSLHYDTHISIHHCTNYTAVTNH